MHKSQPNDARETLGEEKKTFVTSAECLGRFQRNLHVNESHYLMFRWRVLIRCIIGDSPDIVESPIFVEYYRIHSIAIWYFLQ